MKTSKLAFIFFAALVMVFVSFKPDTVKLNTSHLFKIERSKDANPIFYEVNTDKSNNLNVDNPVNVYWIKHTDDGRIEPLTWIQKKYAYGLKFLRVNENETTFQFVSYDKKTFTLKRNKEGNYKVYSLIGNKLVEVNRIFVQIDGGTFWFPKISRVELHAKDVLSGQITKEIINP